MPKYLPLTGLVICSLLARLTVTHWALTDLVSTRLIQSFLGLLSNSLTGLFSAYLRSQGTWSRLLILGYLLGFLRKEEALPITKPLINYTLTCLGCCCLPAFLASLAYLFDLFSKPKTCFSGKHSRSLRSQQVRLSNIPTTCLSRREMLHRPRGDSKLPTTRLKEPKVTK